MLFIYVYVFLARTSFCLPWAREGVCVGPAWGSDGGEGYLTDSLVWPAVVRLDASFVPYPQVGTENNPKHEFTLYAIPHEFSCRAESESEMIAWVAALGRSLCE